MNDKGYLLLVEDEPLVQANNKKILERRGYSVRQAFTLAEAKNIISDDPPRAIVLDILLPDGSGLDFLHELRKTSNIPVLMLTAMGTPQDIVAGLEAGGDDYLPKPYELPVFISRVKALLRRAYMIPDALEVPEDFFADFTKRVGTLTLVERNILRFYLDGLGTGEILKKMYITGDALEKHNARIYSKLGVSGREALMLYVELIKISGNADKVI